MTSPRKSGLRQGAGLALLCLMTISAQGRVQTVGESLTAGPVWSDVGDGFHVLHQRLALNVDPGGTSASGALVWNLVQGQPGASTIVLLENETHVTGVAARGDSLTWRRENGRVLIDLPVEVAAEEFQLTISFEVRGGLHRRSDASGWTAVWTPSVPGPAWLPSRESPFDSFSADTRVFVPDGWDVAIGTDTGPLLPHDIGFAAWKSSSLALDDSTTGRRLVMLSDLHVDGVEVAGLGEAMMQELQAVRGPLALLLNMEIRLPGVLLVTDSEDAVDAWGQAAVVDGLPSLKENDVLQRWHQTERWVRLLLAPRLKALPATDIWLRQALPAYLAAELVNRSDAEGAFGLILEQMRTEYLAETTLYRRPLVWDRWEAASDMLDEHARAKGAWVLHMIRSIADNDPTFFAGIRRFIDRTLDQDLLDSEALRLALESSTEMDWAPFFDVWIYGAGHPELTVSYEHDGQEGATRVRLLQTQEGDFVPSAFPFVMSVQVATLSGAYAEDVHVTSADVTLVLETGLRPSYVYPDARAQVLLDLSPPLSVDEVVSQLRHAESAASRVRALAMLAREEPAAHIMLALRPVLEAETDPSVLVGAALLLGTMQSTGSAERALLDLARRDNDMVRAVALAEFAHNSGSSAAAEAALDAANSSTNAFVLAGAVQALVHLRPEIAWTVVESALVTPSPGDRVRQVALSRAADIQGSDDAINRAVAAFLDLRYPTATRVRAAMTLASRGALAPAVQRRIQTWLGADQAALRRGALELMERGEVPLPPAAEIERAHRMEPVIPLKRRIAALTATG